MADHRDEPHLHGAELDARFESVLSGWDLDAPNDPTAPPEVGPAQQPPEQSVETPDARERAADPAAAPSSFDTGWRVHVPPEIEEHFEPPDPSLPPAHDATYWLALGGIVLGPLLVLWAAFSGNPDPGWYVAVGVVVTTAGFALLVLRGSRDRDPDDDGARV